MAWLDEFRKVNPWANDYSDEFVVRYAANQFGVPLEEASVQTGVALDNSSDTWKSLKAGVQKLPGVVTGLANLPVALVTGENLVDKGWDEIGKLTGFQPSRWAMETQYSQSPELQASRKAVDDVWNSDSTNGWDVAKAYIQNPDVTWNNVVESLPSVAAGGLGARTVMGLGAKTAAVGPALPGYLTRKLGDKAAAVAAGIGEGSVTAGATMDLLADKDIDPRLAAAASLGAGTTTGLIGYGAGRLAARAGIGDLDVAIAGGRSGATMPFYKRVPIGAAQEGILEEAPQSALEQGWQNIAEGKPFTQGMGRQAVEGGLAGAVMGGGMNLPGWYVAPEIEKKQGPVDLLNTPQYRDDLAAFDSVGTQPQMSLDAMDQLRQARDFDLNRQWQNRNPVDAARNQAQIDHLFAEPGTQYDLGFGQQPASQVPDLSQYDTAFLTHAGSVMARAAQNNEPGALEKFIAIRDELTRRQGEEPSLTGQQMGLGLGPGFPGIIHRVNQQANQFQLTPSGEIRQPIVSNVAPVPQSVSLPNDAQLEMFGPRGGVINHRGQTTEATVPPPAPGVSARMPQGVQNAPAVQQPATDTALSDTVVRDLDGVTNELNAAIAKREQLAKAGLSRHTQVVRKAIKAVTALRDEQRKLRDEQIVKEVIDAFNTGAPLTQREFAKKWGVSASTVNGVLQANGMDKDTIDRAFGIVPDAVAATELIGDGVDADASLGKKLNDSGIGVISGPNSTQVAEGVVDKNATDEERRIAKKTVKDTKDTNAWLAAQGVTAQQANLPTVVSEDPLQLAVNQQRANESAAKDIDNILQHPEAQNAAADWDNFKSDHIPAFADLLPPVQADWIQTYHAALDADDHLAEIEKQQRTLERTFDGTESVRGNTGAGSVTAVVPAAKGKKSGGGKTVRGRNKQAEANEAALVSAIAEQWNALGITTWDTLTESQQAHLVDAVKSGDQEAQDRAVSAVAREVVQEAEGLAQLESGATVEGEYTEVTDEEVAAAKNLLEHQKEAVVQAIKPEDVARIEQHYRQKGDRAIESFLGDYANWLVDRAKHYTHKLVDIFERLAKNAVHGIMAVSIAFNVNVSGIESLGKIEVPVNKYQITQTVERPKADFSDVEASSASRMVADYLLRKHGSAKPFIIVDKNNGISYLFKDGKLVSKTSTLTGAMKADLPNKFTNIQDPDWDKAPTEGKITQAGEFNGGVKVGVGYPIVVEMKRWQLPSGKWVAQSMHQTYLGDAVENRPGRLASATPEDNRITWGCVNAPAEWMNEHIAPMLGENITVAVLPHNNALLDSLFPGAATQTDTETIVTEGTTGGVSEQAKKVSWGTGDLGTNEKRKPSQRTAARRLRSGTDGETATFGGKEVLPIDTTVIESTFDEAAAVFANLREVLGDRFDNINWAIWKDKGVTYHETFQNSDGSWVIVLSSDALEQSTADEVVRILNHEVGHTVDDGQKYSSDYRFDMSYNGTRFTSLSPLVNELIVAVRTDSLRRFFSYPFTNNWLEQTLSESGISRDSDYNEFLDNMALLGPIEAWAQLWAAYNAGGTITEDLKRVAPRAYSYMQGVVDEQKRQTRIKNQTAASAIGRTTEGQKLPTRSGTAFNAGIDELRSNAKYAALGAKDVIAKYGFGGLFLSELVRMFKNSQIGGKMQEYYNRIKKISSTAKQYVAEGRKLIEEWRSVDKAGLGEAFSNALNVSTINGAWGNYDFYDEPNWHLSKERVLNEETGEYEWKDLDGKERDENFAKWRKAKEAYDAIAGNNTASALYQKVFDFGKRMIKREYILRANALRDVNLKSLKPLVDTQTYAKIEAAFSDVEKPMRATKKEIRELLKGNKRALELFKDMNAAVDDQIGKLHELQGPYFPLMRFGEWFVVYKSDEFINATKELDDLREKLKEFRANSESLQAIEDARDELRTTKMSPYMSKAAMESVQANRKKLAELRKAAKDDLAVEKEMREEISKLSSGVKAMAENGKHYRVEKHESKMAAAKRAGQLDAEYNLPDGNENVYYQLGQEWVQQQSTAGMSFLTKLEGALTQAMPKTVEAQALQAVRRTFIETAHDQSSLKHLFMGRKNVEGYNKDALRVFSSFVMQASHRLANMEHFVPMQETLDDLTATTKKIDKNGGDMTRATNELLLRYGMDLNYQEHKWLARIASANHVYTLGITPAYLLQQLLQTPIISVPMLAAKTVNGRAVGMQQAWNHVSSAVQTAWKINKLGAKGDLDLEDALKRKVITQGEYDMLTDLFGKGLLDIFAEHDVGEIAEGGSKFWRGFKAASDKINWAARQTETLNRLTTALAAYRATNDANYAADLVTDSQIDYSDENAPRYLKANSFGGFARIIGQFRKFQLGMAAIVIRNAALAFKGDAEAQRTIFNLMLTTFIAAGSMGLPIFGPITYIASVLAAVGGAGADDDENYFKRLAKSLVGGNKDYVERQYKNWLSSLGRVGDILARGLPAAFGADLHRSVGMGDLFSPMPYLRSEAKAKDKYDEFWMSALGPSIGTGRKIADGLDDFTQGKYVDGWSKVLPRWAGAPIKGYKLADQGIKDSSGVTHFGPDKFDAMDIVMQGMGIPLLDTSKYYERVGDQMELSAIKSQQKSRILSDWINGKNVEKERADYNKKYPNDQITYMTKRAKEKELKGKQGKVTENGLAYRKGEDFLKQEIRY